MNILVTGGDGFIGRNVVEALSAHHDVYAASSSNPDLKVDLLDKKTIADALEKVHPDVVINAAGVVSPDQDFENNVRFSTNLLDVIATMPQPPKRVIICGSAAEYGVVDQADTPISEDAPRNPVNPYGQSKKDEVDRALGYRTSHNPQVVVARIFNPLGPGMKPRFIVPRILAQLHEIEAGQRQEIEINRLDAERDYVDVRDLGSAILALVEHDPKQAVYNIGSGRATTNGELIKLMVKHSTLKTQPKIVESQAQPEAPVASNADITRLEQEFGWHPRYATEQTIEEIMHDASKHEEN